MKRTLLALAVAALGILIPSTHAFAQGSGAGKGMARGTISAIGADSITLDAHGQPMKFDVTSQTFVEAKGAGTKTRAAKADGKPGAKLNEVLKAGQAVEVTYLEGSEGSLRATQIRAIATAGSTSESKPHDMISFGTVKSLSNDALTISGSAGGHAKFTQSFTIDGTTKIIMKGGSTASAATGGKLAVTKALAEGDRVSVSYREAGSGLLASEIRVTLKSAARPKA